MPSSTNFSIILETVIFLYKLCFFSNKYFFSSHLIPCYIAIICMDRSANAVYLSKDLFLTSLKEVYPKDTAEFYLRLLYFIYEQSLIVLPSLHTDNT